jgi:hypothetical protein
MSLEEVDKRTRHHEQKHPSAVAALEALWERRRLAFKRPQAGHFFTEGSETF